MPRHPGSGIGIIIVVRTAVFMAGNAIARGDLRSTRCVGRLRTELRRFNGFGTVRSLTPRHLYDICI